MFHRSVINILDQPVWLIKLIIHLAALSPLIYNYFLAFNDQLGADPVEAIIHFTGIGALNILIVSLIITPLSKALKLGKLLKVRRLVGLYSFAYVFCHVFNFLAFEVQFQWSLFISEIIERPYISVGAVSAIVLFLLACTSINQIKRLMGKRWQKLHNWVYLALLLSAIHFYWSVKSEIIEPSVYLLIAIFLLVLRKDKLTKLLKLKAR